MEILEISQNLCFHTISADIVNIYVKVKLYFAGISFHCKSASSTPCVGLHICYRSNMSSLSAHLLSLSGALPFYNN